MRDYLRSTRHPWACLLFLVPLLFAYELGLVWIGGAQTASLRNGADAWLRWAMEVFGVAQVFAVPAVLIVILLVWSWWRWGDRPNDPVRTWFGMAFESCLFAVLLWQFSRNFGPIIDTLGVKLEITANQARAAKILAFIGAGIYEEVLFRLGLFVLLCGVLRVLLP